MSKVPTCPIDKRKQRPTHIIYNHRFDQHFAKISANVQREICKRIARGEYLKHICETENMPPVQSVYDLLWRDPDFEAMYRKARLARAEVLAEELRETAAEAMDYAKQDPKKAMAHVQAVRLKVETDKWTLQKLLPGQYGDVTPSTPDGGKAVAGILEIIKAVSELAREKPVKATVVIPAIEDKSESS